MTDSEENIEKICHEVDTDHRHWVETLFPPTFQLSVQEPFHGNVRTVIHDKHGRELPSKPVACENSEELFVKLARKISPLDVAAVKNVYQRVWLMINAQESVQHDDEIEQSKEVEDDKQIPVTQPTTLQADDQSVFRPVSSGSHTDHDSSIWDSNEIAVLRQAFKATRDENALLCSQVRVLQDDVERMTMERCMQCGSLESTRQRLHQAETANQRLQMLVSHLKTELNRTTNKVDQLRLLAAERNDLTDQLQKMESELSSADYIRDRDVAAIEAKWTKILEEQQLVETETKMQLNNEIIKLVQRAEELEQLLGQEREDHSKARKGLEHLRVHFSSLPASDNKLNSVCKDQLPNWTY